MPLSKLDGIRTMTRQNVQDKNNDHLHNLDFVFQSRGNTLFRTRLRRCISLSAARWRCVDSPPGAAGVRGLSWLAARIDSSHPPRVTICTPANTRLPPPLHLQYRMHHPAQHNSPEPAMSPCRHTRPLNSGLSGASSPEGGGRRHDMELATPAAWAQPGG